jgi:hypothetical protein
MFSDSQETPRFSENPKVHSPPSQAPASSPYPQPDQSNPNLHIPQRSDAVSKINTEKPKILWDELTHCLAQRYPKSLKAGT